MDVMTSTIRNADSDFDFSAIHLGTPHSLQGGAYFSKILFGPTDETLYIQSPKCKCNKGIIKTGKKEYIDLLLTNDNCNFVEWMNHLEETIQNIIYEKRHSWFAQTDELSLDDIQSYFTPPIKVYKGSNFLVRCYLNSNKGSISTLNIFDETQTPKEKEDITEQCDIISIIEIQGLRFSQKAAFQIDIAVKQIMLFSDEKRFSKCLIDNNSSSIVKRDKIPVDINLLSTDTPTEENEKEQVIETTPTEDTEKEQVIETTKDNDKRGDISKIQILEEDPNNGKDTIDLEEVNLEESGLQNLESLTLKKPNEIYYEMYKEAKTKAIQLRKEALDAFLKAKQIKNKYSLEESDDEDDDSEEDELNYLIDS